MERIPEDKILEYNPDTLVSVRKLYNLDKPGQMDEAIDLLDAWIKKQTHFVQKNFSRDYLERVIILLKGSVERAKSQLEAICTLRSLLPEYFNNYNNPREQFQCLEGLMISTLLPKLSEDHYRPFLMKCYPSTKYSANMHRLSHYYTILMCEYMKGRDYNDGIILILDFVDLNIMDLVSAIDFVDMRQITNIFLEGYGTRCKQIFMISSSKTIDVLVTIIKQMISEKLRQRICVLKDIKDLYEFVPKELLPCDYGGKLQSITTLREEFLNVLSSEETKKYLEEISRACTDESLRSSTKINREFLGLEGTFRNLNFD